MEKERIPCDPEIRDTEQCPVYIAEGGCYEDNHHEYWPRRDYKTRIERDFRALVMNQTVMCRFIHRDDRHQQPPPQKPSRKHMKRMVEEFGD